MFADVLDKEQAFKEKVQKVTGGFRGLQGFTMGYKGLQGVTRG